MLRDFTEEIYYYTMHTKLVFFLSLPNMQNDIPIIYYRVLITIVGEARLEQSATEGLYPLVLKGFVCRF